MAGSGSNDNSAQWLLVGALDRLTPYWVQPLVLTRGTMAEWNAIGIPLSLDVEGDPEPAIVWGRRFTFTLLSDSDAAIFPACTSRRARSAGALEPQL
jgi:hypothetical protein